MSLTKVTYTMIEGAVYSPQDYAGANAGEQIAAAIDQLPAEGGVIDARGYTGVQTFASDIFASRKKPFVLLLGNATFQANLDSYSLTLNSHQKVVLNNTTLQPSSAHPQGFQNPTGFFTTNVFQTTGSISSGSNSLTVADASDIEVGCLVSIQGAEGASVNTQTTLASNINASTTSIPLTDASDFPSTYIIYIGTEIITGTERSGNTLINVTRGAYGSAAASHTTGDTVSLATNFRAVVTAVNGTTITLSGNAVSTVINSVVQIGSTDIVIDGIGTFDGRQDRSLADPTFNIVGVKFILSTYSTVGDDLVFKNWDHGGVYLESAWNNYIGGRYTGNTRPSDTLGSSIWVFRRSAFNTVNVKNIEDCYIGIFVDDRTSNANINDGFCNKNTITCSTINSVDACIIISGSDNNTIYAGYLNSDSTAILISTNSQGSTLREVTGNFAQIGSIDGTAAIVVRGQNNFAYIGSTDDPIDNGGATSTSNIVVGSGDSQGIYFSSGIANPVQKLDYVLGGKILFNSTDTSVTTNETLGAIEFASADASSPGAGAKASIRANVLNAAGSSVSLKFGATSTANNLNSFEIQEAAALPGVDNVSKLGSASLRWTEVFAVNGAINTSDEREKTFLTIKDAERAAALEIKANLRKFKFNSAIEKKGDDARIHFGASAQQVGSIMESHGLNPAKYGFFCYDEWEQQVDAEGNATQKSGNRYGIRYDELLCFIMAAI